MTQTANKVINKVSLFYCEGSSDKIYEVSLEETDAGEYVVNFAYGRRGNSPQTGTKTKSPVSKATAWAVYDKIVNEKTGKGYKVYQASPKAIPTVATPKQRVNTIPMLPTDITEEEAEFYLSSPEWGMQEKMDGRHVLAKQTLGTIVASNKKGTEITLPNEVSSALSTLGPCNVDGELVQSLHLFDIIEHDGAELHDEPYIKRFQLLKRLMSNVGSQAVKLVPLAVTEDEKRELWASLKEWEREGAVFKLLDGTYQPGKPSTSTICLKCKFWSDADLLVMRVNDKRSVEVGALNYEPRAYQSVGNVSVPVNYEVPKVGDICKVRYLYWYEGGALAQPVYEGVRDDKDEADRLSSLKKKSEAE